MKKFVYQLFHFMTIIASLEKENESKSQRLADLVAVGKNKDVELEKLQKHVALTEKLNTSLKQAYDELKAETNTTIEEQLEKLKEQERLIDENAQLSKELICYRKKLLAANGRAGSLQCELNKYKTRIKK